jgi:predicted ATPase/class 3 adenylate cyclase
VVTTADLPSGRLAFLFSDIEGSTRLLTDLGERFTALLVDHQRLVRSSLAAHRGIEISTEGDSFFAVFRSALDAVAAAADVQRRLAAHAWPAGHDLRVRVGVHLGRAVLVGDDYVGIDINRAARIANAANGGQVVVSDAAAVDVAGRLPSGLALLDLGRHRLRDIGVEHVWQLEIEGLVTRAAPLRSLEAHPTNLPVESVSLVDREAETLELRRLITEGQLVTVTGPGGIGKSRIAVHAARALVAGFPDGVFYLDLAPIDGLEAVVTELTGILDVRLPPDGDATTATTALLEHLRDRRCLLVLDTVDRHPGAAALVARVIEACAATRVLVTARSPLHIRAERELAVQPLGLPGSRPDLVTAQASPAIELFLQRAQAVSPSFRLTDANVVAVSAVVARLDGLPLAIELAAAAVRILSPAAILDRLERSMPLPGGAAVDAPERQRTLRDTIAWSYQMIEPEEQAMLQRLSVFAGDFDLGGVEAVARDAAMGIGDAPDDLEILGRLVDRSLVRRVESEDEDRYSLLGTIRDFAADELAAAGDLDGARSRHARY